MTNFKLNDVVIVTKNPPNQIVKIKGDIGYIDEFQEATNKKGELVKYVYFKTIELNSFLGGMGSVPIDCIELCDNPVYLKRFQEILEHQRKENEKRDLTQAFSQLERKLKSKEIEFIRLKEKFEDYSEIHSLLTDKLIYDGANLVKFRMESVTRQAFKIEKEIITVKEQMNSPINKQVDWYWDDNWKVTSVGSQTYC